MRIYTEHLHKIAHKMALRLVRVELDRRLLLCRWQRLHPAATRLGKDNRSFCEATQCRFCVNNVISHRQAGVRNGMFFGKAKQLCPSLQAVPYDFEAYKEVALTMYETLAG